MRENKKTGLIFLALLLFFGPINLFANTGLKDNLMFEEKEIIDIEEEHQIDENDQDLTDLEDEDIFSEENGESVEEIE